MLTEINYTLPNGLNRAGVRANVIQTFLAETPGTGTGDNASKYIYYVETLLDGNRIYLKRPAALNNGFDFTVNVESFRFISPKGRRMSNPSHGNIFSDLKMKKNENAERYTQQIIPLLHRVYNISDIHDDEFHTINFANGLPCDVVLKCLKWLFIEQDVTYWNNSGRAMLFTGLVGQGLA